MNNALKKDVVLPFATYPKMLKSTVGFFKNRVLVKTKMYQSIIN